MKMNYISKGQMPPANRYILIYVPGSPWLDHDDMYGVFWKVAKCVYGISKAERKALAKSDNPEDRKRANVYYSEDEQGNNQKPYYFTEFGPNQWAGQKVDMWCELPGRKRE